MVYMLISRCTVWDVWVNDGMLICGILAKNDQTLHVGELVLWFRDKQMCPLVDFQKQMQWLYYLLGIDMVNKKCQLLCDYLLLSLLLPGYHNNSWMTCWVAPPLLSSTRRFPTAHQYVSGARGHMARRGWALMKCRRIPKMLHGIFTIHSNQMWVNGTHTWSIWHKITWYVPFFLLRF